MGESARILATEAMAEAREALAEFADTVSRILAGVDADIQRTAQWLQHDRPTHWKHQVRHREEEVTRAKSAIASKQLTAAPEPASVVEERKALERIKRRLEEARRRQEATRRWAAVFEREAMMYKGAAQPLRTMVAGQIPAGLARIARMMESVEAYLAIRPAPDGAPTPAPDTPGTPGTTPGHGTPPTAPPEQTGGPP